MAGMFRIVDRTEPTITATTWPPMTFRGTASHTVRYYEDDEYGGSYSDNYCSVKYCILNQENDD